MVKYLLVVLLILSTSICLAAPEDVKFASFETDADMPFASSGGANVSRMENNASNGNYSLMLQIKGSPADSWPGLSYSPEKKRTGFPTTR